jgi:hypothetical protein
LKFQQHNDIVVSMIPPLVRAVRVPHRILPPGVHWGTLDEVRQQFGGSGRRAWLMEGVIAVSHALKRAGCTRMYLNGSFVTEKENPDDFDGCWDPAGVKVDLLDPVLLDFSNGRAAQKLKYRGEMFIASGLNSPMTTFLDFFQVEKLTGVAKGIVGLRLDTDEGLEP